MTGMEHAIEHAARLIRDGDPEGMGYAQAHNIASALASAGLIAPAPLTEEWGSEQRHPLPGRPPQTLHSLDRDNAVWQIEHNPESSTGRIMHRYRTDWLPVDRAEGNGSADQ